jgi:paraquat-inducible protein A
MSLQCESNVPPINLCPECDTAYAEVALSRGEIARCPCCGAVLARHPTADIDKALALALTCAILLIIANTTPVLGIDAAGTRTEANVWEAALSMESGWISVAALVLLATMLVIPLTQISLVLWLMSFARARKRAPGFAQVLVLLHRLRRWSMSEVFLLGALVTIVKLSDFLPVTTGPGIWALGILTVLIAVLNRFDPGSWWRVQKGETK